ncbi:MAG: hypothetical protein DGJ47_000816, partial [Rickettsiaceae bacterium]
DKIKKSLEEVTNDSSKKANDTENIESVTTIVVE